MAAPGHLDFLEALDRATRRSVADISNGYEMYLLAAKEGLVANADQATAARWTGDLVTAGYVEPLTLQGGGQRLPPRGVMWTDDELQRGLRYTVTVAGRNEADRVRRLRREQQTDAALGTSYPLLAHAWLQPSQQAALSRHLGELRDALDDERASACVGAAKDLLESALKMAVLQRTGQPPPKNARLSALFAAALPTTDGQSDEPAPLRQIGRSLASVVTAAAELRNTVGTGHGRGEAVDVEMSQARLAASAACAVAEYTLAAQRSSSP